MKYEDKMVLFMDEFCCDIEALMRIWWWFNMLWKHWYRFDTLSSSTLNLFNHPLFWVSWFLDYMCYSLSIHDSIFQCIRRSGCSAFLLFVSAKKDIDTIPMIILLES
jgi:hypothetical protein